ncbi:MAG: bifunctional nuclease family protein [Bdellovibrionales bacterium]|nr:bifunctional nuclease family protein [Bdellovibrionales bacterium]
MKDETAIEMFVGGLVLDPNTQAPVVVLKDESGEVHLPIWIGVAEATSIASAIKELEMARPLTHDLITEFFSELDVRVQRIVVTELKDSTYYAELVVSQGDKIMIFDSRPSDAIAIALRASAPIFVTKAVLDQAQITFAQSGQEASEAVENSEEEIPVDENAQQEEAYPERDFKNIDKEKWNEVLEDLDPDDFKYKT